MTRAHDLVMLRQLLDHSDRLKDGEEDAFNDMLAKLDTPYNERRYTKLTDPQRQWVTDAANRLEIDDPNDDPRERNRDVPRGNEVPTPAVLCNLPKAPPGRRVKA
jgi:hypothetical protein